MKRQYVLEISNVVSMFLKTKAEYINILKELWKNERHGNITHYCCNTFDFGRYIVIRQVFKSFNRLTRKEIYIKIGFRERVEGKR